MRSERQRGEIVCSRIMKFKVYSMFALCVYYFKQIVTDHVNSPFNILHLSQYLPTTFSSHFIKISYSPNCVLSSFP